MHSTILVSLTTLSIGAVSLFATSIAHADDSPTPEIELTATMGPAQEYQRGLTVNGVAPTLRSVVVDGESILAYCIEYWIRAADPDHESAVTSWDEFTGDNHFKTDPQVRQHVAWILRHSYPTLSVEEVADQTGARQLTTTEALTATQAAIWHFTDHFVPDGEVVVESGPDEEVSEHSAANVQAVFDYLTGSANLGLSEQETQASVTLEHDEQAAEVPDVIASNIPHEDDHVFGPILLNSSSQEVDLDLTTSEQDTALDALVLMDETGEAIDLDQAVSAEQLWIHVPGDVESGTVELSAQSIEYGYTGRLIIPEPDGQRRFQTIVVVDETKTQAATEIEFAWEKPPVEEPESEQIIPPTDPAPEPAETLPEDKPAVDQPVAEEPVLDTPLEETVPSPVASPVPTNPVAVESPATDTPVVAEATEADTVSEELATTGAHQTRNVLVALGTIAIGAGLLVLNRMRKRRT